MTNSQKLFLTSETSNPDAIGGRKSPAHIFGQDRLVRIFGNSHIARKEEKVTTKDGKEYWIDVLLISNISRIIQINVAALEVDTYVYGIQKKKSPRHIKNRDCAIMETLAIPVIRIDVDALKEGRRKNKYYMTDDEIRKYVNDKIIKYWHNPIKYMGEVQRG